MAPTLTVKQAALRACVSTSLVYAWIADGTLPHVRVGRVGKRGKILIAVADLDGVLATCKVEGGPKPDLPLSHLRLH